MQYFLPFCHALRCPLPLPLYGYGQAHPHVSQDTAAAPPSLSLWVNVPGHHQVCQLRQRLSEPRDSLASLSMTVLIIPVGLRMFNLSHLPMTVPGPDVSNERCLYTRIVFIIIGMLIYQRLTKVPKVIVAAVPYRVYA